MGLSGGDTPKWGAHPISATKSDSDSPDADKKRADAGGARRADPAIKLDVCSRTPPRALSVIQRAGRKLARCL